MRAKNVLVWVFFDEAPEECVAKPNLSGPEIRWAGVKIDN
jgi:hypothetical protein